ncbi:metal-dependent transcriptional regulator [Atopobacter phocae]|uniref:metal-dependent transcriptional regulator n=1 Tax=Atopobacter phocae TaxID=136492 RepID=UPI000470A338|nr:metal-dependent transcriptional regulator [Atopobacter phocae]
MTPNKEDYLKVIMELSDVHPKVTNKLLAETLQISPPGVTDMMNKLIKSDFAKKAGKTGYVLTQSGLEIASELIRKHRLLEVFLVNTLDFKLNEVHKEAEILEHAVSDLFIERLDNFLNHPVECPHGGIIPNKGEIYEAELYEPLGDLQVGERMLVRRFLDESELLQIMVDKHIQLKHVYEVLAKDTEGITISLADQNEPIQLSYLAAHHIFGQKELVANSEK